MATIEELAKPKQPHKLEELIWDNSEHDNEADDEVDKYEIVVNEQNAKHCENITNFQELDNCPLSTALLKNNGLCNLIELDIDFLHDRDQAHNLKILKLHRGAMELNDINQLHLNAQKLETLCLNDMQVDFSADEERTPPAALAAENRLKELQISNYTKRCNENLLLHVAGKYPDLKTLTIHHKKDDDESYTEELGEDSLAKFAYSPCLETYDVDIYPITPVILKAMDASGAKLRTITRIECDYPGPLMKFVSGRKANFNTKLAKLILHGCVHEEYKEFLSFISETCPELSKQNIKVENYMLDDIWQD
ncbi:hypothetical protein BD408DRAFT_428487 [Parasitella parasitica]|nr:hypothetical protein BD408DRAFT_428487 [Parasitella parasitica]